MEDEEKSSLADIDSNGIQEDDIVIVEHPVEVGDTASADAVSAIGGEVSNLVAAAAKEGAAKIAQVEADTKAQAEVIKKEAEDKAKKANDAGQKAKKKAEVKAKKASEDAKKVVDNANKAAEEKKMAIAMAVAAEKDAYEKAEAEAATAEAAKAEAAKLEKKAAKVKSEKSTSGLADAPDLRSAVLELLKTDADMSVKKCLQTLKKTKPEWKKLKKGEVSDLLYKIRSED